MERGILLWKNRTLWTEQVRLLQRNKVMLQETQLTIWPRIHSRFFLIHITKHFLDSVAQILENVCRVSRRGCVRVTPEVSKNNEDLTRRWGWGREEQGQAQPALQFPVYVHLAGAVPLHVMGTTWENSRAPPGRCGLPNLDRGWLLLHYHRDCVEKTIVMVDWLCQCVKFKNLSKYVQQFHTSGGAQNLG